MPPKNASSVDMDLALVNPDESEEQDITYGLSDFGVETQDGIAHRMQAENEVRNILTSLRPKQHRLGSTSVVYIDLYSNGTKESVGIPIRSVPSDIAKDIRKDLVAPEVPMKKDPRTGEIVEDRQHRDYKKVRSETMELEYQFRWLKMLHGLDMDIYDANDQIVWARDRSVQDVNETIKTLEDMGISSFHIDRINDEIDRISGFVDQIERDAQEKKS